MDYKCDICNYIAGNQFLYKRHLTTKKHIATSNATDDTVYECIYCNYKTTTKWCLSKHNETEKHRSTMEYLNRRNEYIKRMKNQPHKIHIASLKTKQEMEKENQEETIDIFEKYGICLPSKKTHRETPSESKETNKKENTEKVSLEKEEIKEEIDNKVEQKDDSVEITPKESQNEIHTEHCDGEDEEDEDYESLFKQGKLKELTQEILLKILYKSIKECKKNRQENQKLREIIEKSIQKTETMEQKIDEISKQQSIINHTINNTTIINNVRRSSKKSTTSKTVPNNGNLDAFLNEKCKDAINIDEFVKSLNYGFDSLEYVGKNGYVNGITKLIKDRLEELNTFERPIHCTDLKREIMYIKSENNWEKDTPEIGKLKHIVYNIGDINMKQISKWQDVYHLEISVLDSKMCSFYFDIIRESSNVGKKGERNDCRVVSNICQMVHLPRDIIKKTENTK